MSPLTQTSAVSYQSGDKSGSFVHYLKRKPSLAQLVVEDRVLLFARSVWVLRRLEDGSVSSLRANG